MHNTQHRWAYTALSLWWIANGKSVNWGKIIDMQAPYHIRLHIIHVVDDEVSSHDMEIVEPAIKSDDKISVVL